MNDTHTQLVQISILFYSLCALILGTLLMGITVEIARHIPAGRIARTAAVQALALAWWLQITVTPAHAVTARGGCA